MSRKIMPPKLSEEKQTAAEARKKIISEGGVVPLWKLPRDAVPKFETIFKTPEELWDCACDYFQWAEQNPLEYTVEIGRNTGQFAKVKKPRPYHIRSFFNFAGITKTMWDRLTGIPEMMDVIDQIEHVIYVQKFDNAMVGVFDAGMASKDLGLADKRELTADVNANVSNVSAREILLSRLQSGQ